MRTIRILLLIALLPFAHRLGPYVSMAGSAVEGVWCDYALSPGDREFRKETSRLIELHTPSGDPKPGDWRATVVQPAQLFSQYAMSSPVTPTRDRTTIYVLPLGTFTPAQRQLVEYSAEFLGLYFCCPVAMLHDAAEGTIPSEARRIHAITKEEQFLSTWIISDLLPPLLPDDGVALIALTATDLWPGQAYNFVFGQASLEDRVGVWSMARSGDPEISDADFRECLRRNLRTATHETGHMFSMQHCVHFECNMAGSGSLEESDKHPLYLCPECLAKLHWAIRPNVTDRLRRLAAFCGEHELHAEQRYYEEAAALLE